MLSPERVLIGTENSELIYDKSYVGVVVENQEIEDYQEDDDEIDEEEAERGLEEVKIV